MLENLLKHCTRWIGIAGLSLGLQACDRPPSRGISGYPDGHVVMPADAAVEKDGPLHDRGGADGYLILPDAGSDSAFPDAQHHDGKYDAQTQEPDGGLPDVQSFDATTPDATVAYDALSPDSLLGSDGSLIPDAFPVDSGGYNVVDAAPDAEIENPDATIDGMYLPDTLLPDGQSDTNDGSLDATVDGPLNNPPILYPIGNYVVNEGELLEFIVSANDPDGDPLIFGAGSIPAGANFNPATQLFNWTPTYEQAGQYQTTFLVSDGELFDVETIDITVLDTLCQQLYFEDADGDGFGNPNSTLLNCGLPLGYVENDLDCDDTDSSKWQDLWGFVDNDGDGYGTGSIVSICAGDSLPAGYVTNSIDCNDLDDSVWQELAAYVDNDLDGHGAGDLTTVCMGDALPEGYALNNDDCDDTNPLINPFATEDCDGLDNDCSSIEDDNLTASNRECSVGQGACIGYGLEYKICLGMSDWSEEYFNCDAVEGEPSEEICDGIDNDCNGLSDDGDIAIIDDFNRPDQNGLGWNAFGEWWAEYGTCDDWDIVNDAAETFWIGLPCYNPNTHSEIGHHDTFNILTKFRFFNTNGSSGNGALVLNINASGGQNGSGDGLAARIAINNYSTHALVREGIDLAFGSTALANNIDYLLRFSYDGSQLQLKIWEEGTTEPALPLISAAADDVSPTRSYMTITGDMDTNEQAGVSIDYIVNGKCDYDNDTIPDAEDNCPLVPNSGLKDTLLEGEWKEYQVNGTTYGVTLSFVDSDEAKFNVNGEATSRLKVNQSYTLQDTSKIIVRDVLYQDYAGGVHTATFRIGAQKDSDGDGIGNACDTTPLGVPEAEE